MIQEDYVSFELAKLLKERGFDGSCNRYYEADKKDVNGEHASFMFASDLKSFCYVTNDLLNKYADKNDETILAPTLQMAMDWLRDEHHYHIEIGILKPYKMNEKRDKLVPDDGVLYHANIFFMDKWDPYLEEFHKVGMGNEKTPEAQTEEAIKYCLEELI